MDKINCALLIDDDTTTNFLHQTLIEDLDITEEVKVAKNGLEALRVIEQQCSATKKCPDLIFLDINMPMMDGFEFLDAYQKLSFANKETVVIVMLTTSLNSKDVERAKGTIIDDYINKPLTEEKLKEVMDKHFNK